MLGEAAGSATVGVRRIEAPAGDGRHRRTTTGPRRRSSTSSPARACPCTPGATSGIRAGDCIVYLPRAGAHTLHAETTLDVLAFGTRQPDNAIAFPRLGCRSSGPGATSRCRAPSTGGRSSSSASANSVRRSCRTRPAPISTRSTSTRSSRNVSIGHGSNASGATSAGPLQSVRTGIEHVTVTSGHESAPLDCHSHEEEIFVIFYGAGTLVLGTRRRRSVRAT